MKTFNLKKLSVITLIDFIFVTLFYLLAKNIISKVKVYYELIQSLTTSLDKFNNILQQNASQLDINQLGINVELINQISNKIISWLFGLFIVMFLIYLVSQSVSWNLALNNLKFKNYKAYLWKFTLISIPVFILIIYLGFNLLVKLKPFILDYWFKSIFSTSGFIEICLLFLVILLIKFYTITAYVLINKNSLKNSLTLLVNNLKITKFFFILLLIVLLGLISSIKLLKVNPNSLILVSISALLFLMIYNFFKLFLVEKCERI